MIYSFYNNKFVIFSFYEVRSQFVKSFVVLVKILHYLGKNQQQNFPM